MEQQSTIYINKLYDNATFFDLYFSSILFVLCISTVVILFASVGKMMSNANIIKASWDTERCKPSIIPFAGFINKPVWQTIAEYTITNFKYCANKALTHL